MQNSLFPLCTTSISNNSGSIEERTMEFAYSRGFSEWWVKWCDRHLCHMTGSGLRVTLVAYKLEQSIMRQKSCFCIACVNLADLIV